MKKLIIIIAILLFFVNISSAQRTSDTGLLPIAYVDVDTLLINYNYAIDANKELMDKYNSSSKTLTQKQKELETKVSEFQKKIENNTFHNRDRAEQEAAGIQKFEADIQILNQKLKEEHIIEQERINTRIADSVKCILKEINKTSDYHIIFTNTGLDNILVSKDGYNITQKVLNLLNSRYKPETSE